MAAEMEILEAVLRQNGAEAFSSAKGDDLDDLWDARRGCIVASMAFYGGKVYFANGCAPKALENAPCQANYKLTLPQVSSNTHNRNSQHLVKAINDMLTSSATCSCTSRKSSA